jgi:hypothetical protein
MPSRAEVVAPGLARLVHNVHSRPSVYDRCPRRASHSGIRTPPESTEAPHHDIYPLRRPGVPINVFALLCQGTLFPPSRIGKERRLTFEWREFQPEDRGRARS